MDTARAAARQQPTRARQALPLAPPSRPSLNPPSHTTLTPQVEKKTVAEEVNAAFREAAAGAMGGVLAVSDEPLVSVDFRCTDVSTSIDSSLTMVMGDDMVKVGLGMW